MTSSEAEPADVREVALRVVRRLREGGHQALWAGGSVRDRLLGREASDIDVATSARPDEVQAAFRRSIPVGVQFGVVRVRERAREGVMVEVEVATFRVDAEYEDGRRPASVRFTGPEEDARRRDFTINGLFYDPIDDEVLDFVGGRDDLVRGVVRAIGDAHARFLEDRLRILRAPRFAAALGFRLDEATVAAGRGHAAEVPACVSPERVHTELQKVLDAATRARGLALCEEVGVLAHVLPEARVDLPRALRALAALPADAPVDAAWAAALHLAGPAAAEAALARLRASNAQRERVRATLEALDVAGRLWELGVAEQKRFLRRPEVTRWAVGADPVFDEVLRAVLLAGDGDLEPHRYLTARARAFAADPTPARFDAPPLVRGADLQAAGLKPGKHFGPALAAAEEAQLEGRAATREDALAIALAAAGA
ncbi:MAG: CCA tRNA nucleotidyltransferase [Planctomycetes bacterium]|nr:CCA tRNA nucleotidyltransferase [Planctomycetota bacterium]